MAKKKRTVRIAHELPRDRRIAIKKALEDHETETRSDWDRENEMKYIYKILDLMNRNYDLESISPALKTQYLEKSKFKCEGLN